MEYGPELADPLVDVRDVVESFRKYGVTPPDWRPVLAHATAALDELAPKPELGFLPPLVGRLNQLLADGLATHANLVSEVADQVTVVLASVNIPAMPKPADHNWGFDTF
jgi:hypothetical protein